ncbi:hypothetical protein D3C73_785110 [compost metagenome]
MTIRQDRIADGFWSLPSFENLLHLVSLTVGQALCSGSQRVHVDLTRLVPDLWVECVVVLVLLLLVLDSPRHGLFLFVLEATRSQTHVHRNTVGDGVHRVPVQRHSRFQVVVLRRRTT